MKKISNVTKESQVQRESQQRILQSGQSFVLYMSVLYFYSLLYNVLPLTSIQDVKNITFLGGCAYGALLFPNGNRGMGVCMYYVCVLLYKSSTIPPSITHSLLGCL